MSDNEEVQNDDSANTIRERVLSILGTEHGKKKIDEIVFEMARLADSKPAILVDFDVSFEKLERFAPPGYCIVEIAGKKIIVNLAILDRRMPWGVNPPQSRETRLLKPPLIVDVSPGLKAPRLLNVHDLPHNAGDPDTVGNSNLFYKTEEICEMLRGIRKFIFEGERIIEKRNEWKHVWCPETIFACLLGDPVCFWSDCGGGPGAGTCLPPGSAVWRIEWIDGEARRPVYSFTIPHALMTSGVKAYLQRWTDGIFDRSLPHQNFYMLQTKEILKNVIL